MRPRWMLALTVAAAALATAPEVALARTMAMVQADKESGLFLDRDEVRPPSGGKSALAVWQMFAHADGGADYTLARYEFDCVAQSVRVASATEYAITGGIVRQDGGFDWTPVPANSVGRVLMGVACGQGIEPVKSFGDIGPDEALREYRAWTAARP